MRATVLMVISGAAGAIIAGIIRVVARDMDVFEIVFFRNLFSLIFLAPWLIGPRRASLRTRRLGLHGLRAVCTLLSMIAWFAGIAMMPLAEAVALHFTAPLFGTLAAIFILGEMVGWRRWSATVIGFAGVLIILRPGFEAVGLPAFIVLFSALTLALQMVCVRVLAATDSTVAIVTYMVLLITPMSLIPALFVWQTPNIEQIAWLIALAGFATLAHFTLTRAYALVDVSVCLPLDFIRMPLTALVGYFAFAELADGWVWVGAIVIVAATVYTAQRESRARAAPPAKS